MHEQLVGGGAKRRRRKFKARRRALLNCRISPAELSRDLCNIVTSLSLFTDLLAQPGVLAAGQDHYVEQLEQVTQACNRVLGKILEAWKGELPGTARVGKPQNCGPMLTKEMTCNADHNNDTA